MRQVRYNSEMWIASVVVLCLSLGGSTSVLAQGEPITFSVTGDIPYGTNEVPTMAEQIAKHNLYSPSDFFVHVGDLNAGSESCKESRYIEVAEMLKTLAVPAYVIPGDNEWVDCSNPDQAWNWWTSSFYDFEDNFCGVPIVERQDVRPENFAFMLKGVLFVGINIPAGRQGGTLEADRLQDDADWVDFQFTDKVSQVRAAVVFGHAGNSGNRGAFFTQFQVSARNFVKPVLYVMGDRHSWKVTDPWMEPNMMKIVVNRGGLEDPVQLTAGMGSDNSIWEIVRNPLSGSPQLFNREPCVEAGSDQIISQSDILNLSGNASDDGVPNNPVNFELTWSKASGPGTVSFNDVHSLSTTATFSAPGNYMVRLTGNDGGLQGTDEMLVTVESEGPVLTVSDPFVTEGNSGTTSLVFTVEVVNADGSPVTVHYQTADSTAQAGLDYTAISGDLTFSGGTTTRTVAVAVIGETDFEPDELVQLRLSNATGAPIGKNVGLGTIENDDQPQQFTLDISVQGIGNMAPSPGPNLYIEDSQVIVSASQTQGDWAFDHWQGDLTGSANPDTILMDSDKNIIAVFVFNNPPTASNDSYAVNEDGNLQITAPGLLLNDSDVDGDAVVVADVQTPAHGSVTFSRDGAFGYTPTPDFFGQDTMLYIVHDGKGKQDTANALIDVLPSNDLPVGVADVYAGDPNQTVVVAAPGVLTNDIDVDGDLLSAQLQTTTSSGTLNFLADGSFTYVPDNGFTGTDEFTYLALDSQGPSTLTTVEVAIGLPTIFTFNPLEDGQVRDTSPDQNYGADATLRIRDGSPLYSSFLKFNLSGIGAVISAKLRLYVTDPGPNGGAVALTSNNFVGTSTPWDEDLLNWGNAPVINGTLSSLGEVFADTWVEFDVTSGVSGPGIYSFGVQPASTNSVIFSSKEGTHSPQLIVEAFPSGGGSLPDITLLPASHDFGGVNIDSSRARLFEIRNDGTADLLITNITLQGVDVIDFGILSGGSLGTLAQAGSQIVEVQFTPSATGIRNATLHIESNDPDENPFDVSLAGTGLATPGPNLVVTPVGHDFGLIQTGSSASTSFDVHNNGTTDLDVTLVTIAGLDAPDFSLDGTTTSFMLIPGQTRSLGTSFSPAATGAKSANLLFVSNDPDTDSLLVPLSGTAFDGSGGSGQVAHEETQTGSALSAASVATGLPLVARTGDIYVAAIALRRVVDVTAVDGLGLNWSRVQQQCAARGQTSVEVWIGQGVPTTSESVTATFASSVTSASIAVARYSGADLNTPIGNIANGNSLGLAGACSGGTDSPAYSFNLTTTTTGSVVFGAATLRNRSHTSGAGYIERAELESGTGGDATTLAVQDQSVTIPGSIALNGAFSSSVDWAVVGFELRPGSTGPDIALSPETHDFGSVVQGSNAEQTFKIRNQGGENLNISQIQVTGTDSTAFVIFASDGTPTLAAGDSHEVIVRFTPTVFATMTANLSILSNDSDESPFVAPLSGTGVAPPAPDIAATPASIDFGDLLEGLTTSSTIILRNMGSADLSVSSLAISGVDSAEFSIIGGGPPFILNPDSSRVVEVGFSPATAGAKTATLNIASNDPDENPFAIPLAGNGLPAVPDIALIPDTLGFGDLIAGLSSQLSLQVRNVGDLDLSVSSTTLVGAQAGEFGIASGGGAFVLNPDSSRTLTLSFNPDSAGAKNATLQFASNDPDENPAPAVLLGNGLPAFPDIFVSKDTLDFGQVLTGTTGLVDFEVRNNGVADLNVNPLGLLGADIADFSVFSGDGPFVLKPDSSRIIQMQFAPVSAGPKQATVQIVSDDPDENPTVQTLLANAILAVPDIANLPDSLDFGSLLEGTTSTQLLEIQNTGVVALDVTVVTLTGPDAGEFGIVAGGGPFVLQPDSSRMLTVQFAPDSAGAKTAFVHLESNDPDESPRDIPLHGTGVPAQPNLALSPDSVQYGDVVFGATVSRTIEVRNTGVIDLDVFSLGIRGATAEHFKMPDSSGFVLNPDSTRLVEVRFTASTLGLKLAFLQIVSNDPDQGVFDVPLSANSVPLAEPEIDVARSSLEFGGVKVGDSNVGFVTVENLGTADLQVSSLALNGPESGDYQLLSAPFTVLPGDTHDVDIQFSPSTPDLRNATLQIFSNDADESLVEVQLSGVGLTGSTGGGDVVFESTHNGATVNATSVATTEPVPGAAGQLYLAAISMRRPTDVTGVSGMGLTWVRLHAQCTGRGQTGLEVWHAIGTGSGGPVTATLTTTVASAVINVTRYSGIDENSPFGNLVFGNSNGPDGACSGGTDGDAYNFDIATTADGAIIYGAAALRNKRHTPGNGYVERDEAFAGSGGDMATVAIEDQSVAVASTRPLDGAFSKAVDWAVIGVEIRPGGGAAPDIVVSPVSHDFGSIVLGNTSAQTFQVLNLGTVDLNVSATTLEGIDASSFQFTTGQGAFVLPSGVSRNIEVQFAPASSGTKTGALRLVSDDPDVAQLDIPLFGTALAPDILALADTLDFAVVVVGSTGNRTASLRNVGTSPLQVSAAFLVGPDSANFAIAGGAGAFTLQPDSTKNIAIHFAPTSSGLKQATLRIASDDPDENYLDITLFGSGLDPIPDIAASPVALDFGSQFVGQAATLSVIIQNLGVVDLSVSSATMEGANPSEFGIVNGGGPFVLSPDSSRVVEVQFSPTVTSASTAALRLMSNDPDESPFDVSVSGVGLPALPDINTDIATVDYGSLLVGVSSLRTIVLSNAGVVNLEVTATEVIGPDSLDFSITSGAGGFTLAPDSSRTLGLIFVPGASGLRQATLRVQSNDPDENPFDIPLQGGGIAAIPDIASLPVALDFGDVVEQTTSARNLVLSNAGVVDLEISALQIVGVDPTLFAITAGAGPFTLNPDSSRTIEISFTPDGVGAKNAVLRVSSNDPDENPFDVPLTGNGVLPDQPDIAVSPASLDFGNITQGSSSGLSLLVRNDGTADLNVSSLQITGAGAGQFSVAGAGFVLAPNTSQSLDIGFTPSSIGSKNAIMQITSDDPDENPFETTLAGFGLSAPIGGGDVVFEESQSGGAVSATSVATTTPVAGVNDHLYLAAISFRPPVAVTSVSGLGLVWTRVQAQCSGRGQTGVEVWSAIGVSTGTGVVTADFASTVSSGVISVTRYSGADPSNPIGDVVFGNTQGISGACSGGTDSPAYQFSLNTSVDGAVVYGASALRNRDHFPGAAYTERDEASAGSGGSTAGVAVQEQTVASAGSVVFDGSFNNNVDWAIAGLEIRPGAGGDQPDIAASPSSHNFGDVVVGANTSHVFQILNAGTADLAVSTTALTGTDSADFQFLSGNGTFILPSGLTRDIEVDFAPGSGGTKNARLRIESNDPNDNPVEIDLLGNGVAVPEPDITVGPLSHDYGSLFVGQSATRGFVVRNDGTANLEVTSTMISGLDAAEFAVSGGGGTFMLAPGDSQTVSVQFAPADAGSKSAALEIGSADPDEATVTAALSGAGLREADIAVSPANHDFGDVVLNATATMSFEIRNTGNEDLSVSTVSIAGGDASEFAIQGGSGAFVINPDSTRTIAVDFSPTLIGQRLTTLRIASNDPDENPFDVALSGNGTPPPAPDIAALPDSNDFGDVVLNTTATQTFEIRNTGNLDLHVSATALSGANADVFAITTGGGAFTLAPADTRNIAIRFAPTTLGAKAAALELTSDDPDEATFLIPLLGNGIAVPVPEITVLPASLDYGSVVVGVSSSGSFEIRNDGQASLSVSGLSIIGTDKADFVLADGTAFSVAAGTSQTVDVTFVPTSTGAKSATLRLANNDADESVLDLPLSGTGTEPPPSADVNLVDVQNGASTNAVSVTSTTVSAATDHLYLASIAIRPLASVTGVSGLGLSWQRIKAQCAGRGQTTLEVWRAIGTPSAGGAVTAIFSTTVSSAAISVTRYSGVNPASPVGSIISGNTQGPDGTCGGGTDSPAYLFDMQTSSDGAVVFGAAAMRNRRHQPGAQYTEQTEIAAGSGGGTAGLATQDRTVASAGAVTFDGSFNKDVDWAVIALEIVPGSGSAGTPEPDIAANPASHDFGEASVGDIASTTIEIRNAGNAELSVSSAALSGADAADFGISNGGGAFTLPADGTRNVQLEFAPSSAGAKVATLRLESNDPDESPFDIPLSGAGVNEFTLSVSIAPSGSGSVGKTPNKTTFTAGESVFLNATASSGFEFSYWTGDIGGANPVSNDMTLSMTRSRSVVANFVTAPPGSSDVVTPVRAIFHAETSNADDMCIWLHPTDPTQSTIIMSDKSAKIIAVVDLQNNPIQSIPLDGSPGNIDIRYNFRLSGQPIDIVAHTNKSDDQIVFYKVDRTTRELNQIGSPDAGGWPASMNGVCLYHSPNDGKLYAFATGKDSQTRQWEVVDNGDSTVGLLEKRTWDVGEGESEGMVADDEAAKLYVANEDFGVWKFDADPTNPSPTGQLIVPVDSNGVRADVEGLSIYYASGGTGYLIVSNQGNSDFKIFDRKAPHTLLKTFEVDGASSTDGLDVINLNLGTEFPKGLFVCHSSTAVGTGQEGNLLVDFEDIGVAFNTDYWDPRNAAVSPPQFLLTTSVQSAGAGTILRSPDKPTYSHGDTVLATAIPEPGLGFVKWTGDIDSADSTDNPVTLTMDQNRDLSAVFDTLRYSLTVNFDPVDGGLVAAVPDQLIFKHGESVVLTATATSGFEFLNWSGDVAAINSSDNPLTLTMDQDRSVTAGFSAPATTVTFEDAKPGAATASTMVATAALVAGRDNHLYLAAIATTPPVSVSAVSGLGLTWTLAKSQCSGQNQTGIEVWTARGSVTGDGMVMATFASTAIQAVISVSRYSGVAELSPLNSVISGNANGPDGICNGGTDGSAYNFDITTSTTGAMVYGAATMLNQNHIPGNGFTERSEIFDGVVGSVASVATQDREVTGAGTLSLAGTLTSATDWAVVGFEITPDVSGASLAAIGLATDGPGPDALALPGQFELSQNYPNPFNAETTISYALPEAARVKLSIFNVKGQLVRTLVDEYQEAGFKKLRWDGRNRSNIVVGSDVYLLRAKIGEHVFNRKLVLQK